MTSQRLPIQRYAPSATAGCKLKGDLRFPDPQFLGLGQCQLVGVCTNWKPAHDFPIPSNTKFCSIFTVWPQFQCQVMTPQFDPRSGFGGQGGPMRSKMVPVEISSPHSHATSIHTIVLYCTVWPQNTKRQSGRRQTDRAIGIGSPCYRIGSLKIEAIVLTIKVSQTLKCRDSARCIFVHFYQQKDVERRLD